MSNLNSDGQPFNPAFNSARLNDRRIDELIGLCRGILADGVVCVEEANYLQDWIRANQEISDHWPANILFKRLEEALVDGKLDAEEERDLLETLLQITGTPASENKAVAGPTDLPICDPAPAIDFYDSAFCFTGKFATGSRKKVENMVKGLGGSAKGSPSKKVRYVVIGSIGSSDWIHSTHGRKIEKAVTLRDSGIPISIITEEHWYNSLPVDVTL